MLGQRYKIFHPYLYYRIKNKLYFLTNRAPAAHYWVPNQTTHRVPNSDGDAVEDLIGAGTGRNRRCVPCR